MSHCSCWLSCDFYLFGVGYPATDLNVISSGIGMPGFLVNYNLFGIFFGVGYPATDLNVSSSGIGLSGFLVNYHLFVYLHVRSNLHN